MNRTSLLVALIVPALLGACGAGENTVGTDWPPDADAPPDTGSPPDTSFPSDPCSHCTPVAAKLVVSASEACLTARGGAGKPVDSQSFEISNQGAVSSGALTVSLSGNEQFHFSLSKNTNTCTGSTLAPGARCAVVVFYDAIVVPANPAGVEKANLIVTDGVTSVTALLRGSSGTVTARPTALDFGALAPGLRSDELFVFVSTDCETNWTASIDDPNFVISSSTCTGDASACQIGVRFAPPAGSSPMSTPGSLTVSASDTSTVKVALSGDIRVATPRTSHLTALPSPLDFGEVIVGQSANTAFTACSPSSDEIPTVVVGGPGGAQFIVESATRVLTKPDADATCYTFQIKFVPTAAGPSEATVTVTDGTETVTVALQGKGVAAAVPRPFTIAPTAVDFGLLRMPMSSDPVTIYVTTPGVRTFTATLSDGAATEVAIIENTCTTLVPAGGTCVIRLVYTPTKKSVLDGALTVSDGSNVVTVTMVGVATVI